MKRRSLIKIAAAAPALTLLPGTLRAAEESHLIYLSPLKQDGSLSACQAEVWFVGSGQDYYVVTGKRAWRARAVENGLTSAKVWVGDVGVWHDSDGAYLELPSLTANASFERDATVHARLLNLFGNKYADEWGTWGPRFKKGLADGSRVMLKYSPA